MRHRYLYFIFSTIVSNIFYAQAPEDAVSTRTYTTALISQEAPRIDGDLSDASWSAVEWGGDFVQRQPNEGIAPTYQTRFKINYDDSNLYVAVQCLDSSPDSIVKRLSRRDGFEGDWVWVAFDSYHDKQSCYGFLVSASGVQSDEFISRNGNDSDSNWNSIWECKTQVDSEGWTAEIRIPLSQLRFSDSPDQVWGLQIMRKLFRKEEKSVWQRIPLDASGWVSEFGELHGLKGIKPQKQMEIQPYVLAQMDAYTKEEGNPYRTGHDNRLSGGLDAKIGLSNALTMDLTINPDFGQVEADPAAIALDGFQIFFQERRPFFIENRNIFSFGVSPSAAGNTFGNDNLFYSRRIGKNPSGYPQLEDGEYASLPSNTTILGAAKVSGQTKNGWSVGILETVTDREYASIDNEGEERQEIIEPLTNYTVGRVRKDFNDKNSYIGGILTSTNRKLEGDLDFLHSDAITGGLDFQHQWKDQTWYLTGNALFSTVKGSEEAISDTQQSIRHLFQRVGASHLEVDTTRTSLSGTGGHLKLGKNGGRIMFESGMAWRSPELELNDVGFMRQSDDIRHFTWAGYRWREPFSIFRSAALNYNHWVAYDFEGNLNNLAWNVNTSANFKNNWWAGTGMNITPLQYSNFELRGGPRYRYVPDNNGWFWMETDGRKKVQLNVNLNYGASQDDATRYQSADLGIGYRPTNALSISLGPEYTQSHNRLQYVTEAEMDGDPRYITSRIDRETLALSLRMNYTINTKLTVQFYGQPYITKGTYSDFNHITDATSKFYAEKSYIYDSEQIELSDDLGLYSIDENKDGASDYEFDNPDFRFFQFRSNLVLRWEYQPGSEIYFVWSQGGTDFVNERGRNVYRDLRSQLSLDGLENTFLIKATYRLSL